MKFNWFEVLARANSQIGNLGEWLTVSDKQLQQGAKGIDQRA
jgi:hypothetical protein